MTEKKSPSILSDNDDEGWILEDGDNRTVRIKADIISGVEEN
jgi:hypothetical protein